MLASCFVLNFFPSIVVLSRYVLSFNVTKVPFFLIFVFFSNTHYIYFSCPRTFSLLLVFHPRNLSQFYEDPYILNYWFLWIFSEYVLLTKSDALFIIVLKQQIFGLFPEYVLLKKSGAWFILVLKWQTTQYIGHRRHQKWWSCTNGWKDVTVSQGADRDLCGHDG